MTEISAWFLGLLAAIWPGFGEPPPKVYNGYVEADYVYAAADSAGRIDRLAVSQGDMVKKGTLLFVLETERQSAVLRAAEAQEQVAEATWHNLETGSRVEEIAVIRASVAQAKADRTLATSTLDRSLKLHAQGLTPDAVVEANQAAVESADAKFNQLEAQLTVAELPARDAQLVAAEATLEARRADVDRAMTDLQNRQVIAPIEALVERVFFRAGEVASAGTPVLSLLPPDALKVRFYVPEADRAAVRFGETLIVSCSGCPDDLTASINYLASQPQHTPPIIYSREERARLVFMAEAELAPGTKLLPGQPVTLVHP